MIVIYHGHKNFTFNGLTEAALWVASNESISNIYSIELAIMRCILCGTEMNNYKFKIKEDK